MSQGEIIDGKAIAQKVRAEVGELVSDRLAAGHRAPGLATVLVGEDPASEVYVRNKRRAAEKAGIQSIHHQLPSETTENELLPQIDQLN